MSILNTGLSAISKLAVLGLLSGAFLFGMAGVVYMSLQGDEIVVPEITGKDLSQGEKELALLGLKIKKRASRFSAESPNIVVEQLPKPGEMVKTGQLILVVTSKGPGDGDQPASLKNTTDQDDVEKIEEMISDKPKKPKANSNSNSNKKKPDTGRDVTGNNSDSDSKSDTVEPSSNKKETGSGNSVTEKTNKNTQTPAANRSPAQPSIKPPGGESRPKPQPQN